MSTQQPLWTPPTAAAIGESLERLAAWCDRAKHMAFTMQRTSVQRVRHNGMHDVVHGWAIDVRRRGAVVHTITAGSLEELARNVSGWIDDQLAGVRQLQPLTKKGKI